MTKKEHSKDFYAFFCSVPNLLILFMPRALLSQQEYQDEQNCMHFTSKTHLEIIVQTSTMVFIISNLGKGATNNLTIAMRKFMILQIAH